MTYIEITDEQARVLAREYPVQVRDCKGRVLGYIEPVGFTSDEVKEAKRRAASHGPWYTGQQVREHFDQLENSRERHGINDKAQLRDLLQEIRSPEAT